jgi:hypothetical protein
MFPDEDLHRHAAENIVQADALLFGPPTCNSRIDYWEIQCRSGTLQGLVASF